MKSTGSSPYSKFHKPLTPIFFHYLLRTTPILLPPTCLHFLIFFEFFLKILALII